MLKHAISKLINAHNVNLMQTQSMGFGTLIKEASSKQQIQKQMQDTRESNQLLTSPVVRMIARQNNINLSKVQGTGKKGRILKEDIINYISEPSKYEKKTIKEPQERKIIGKIVLEQKKVEEIIKPFKVKMNNFERAMQISMTEANKIPHLYYHEEFQVSQLQIVRSTLKEKYSQRITLMSLFIKTFSLALSKHQRMNSTYNPQDQFLYQIHSNHNISIAINSKSVGLVVPNIKNIRNLTILEIQNEIQSLRTAANEDKLTNQNITGGTICLSNIGAIGGISACPLLFSSQNCIVAIGKIVQSPYFSENKQLSKRKTVTMTFGCDHRVIDGATVAKFSNSWKSLIENPYLAFADFR